MSIRVGAYFDGMKDNDLFDGRISEWFQHTINHTKESEIHLRPWPENSQIIPASGNIIKIDDLKTVISGHMTVISQDQLVRDTTPESKEEFATPFEIAYRKAHDGIIDAWRKLPEQERKDRLQKAHITTDKDSVVWSHDLWVLMDGRIADHPIWDDVKNNCDDPLVLQAFSCPMGFPGARTKELTSALGGEKEFLRRLKTATQDLGIEFSSTVLSTMWLGPLVPNSNIPLPAQGFVIQTTEKRSFQDIDYSSEKLFIPNFDYVDVVLDQGRTAYDLREDKSSDYHKKHSLLARSMRDVIESFSVPLKGSKDDFNAHAGPVKLVSNLQMGHCRRAFGPKSFAGCEMSRYTQDIAQPITIDAIAAEGHGIMIETPPPNFYSGRKVNDFTAQLLRKLDDIFLFSHIFSLQQFDASHFSGKIHAVERKRYEEIIKPWLKDFFQKKLTGNPKKYLLLYDNEEDLRNQIAEKGVPVQNGSQFSRWEHDYLDEAGLKAAYGMDPDDDFGFMIGLYGSATAKMHQAIEDARILSMALAGDNDGLSFSSGGGTDGVMGAYIQGLLMAREAGYTNFRKFATRARIVSNREGSNEKFYETFGLSPDDPNFYVREVQHLMPRQMDVMAPCSAHVLQVGGSGTIDEGAMALGNNVRINATGSGLFKGFQTYKRTSPVIFINTPMPDQSRFFDFFAGIFTDAEKKAMGMHVCSGDGRLYEAWKICRDHKDELEITKRPKRRPMHGKDNPALAFG